MPKRIALVIVLISMFLASCSPVANNDNIRWVTLEDIEKKHISKALELSNGNQSKAARLLKIPRHVLLYRLEKYNI